MAVVSDEMPIAVVVTPTETVDARVAVPRVIAKGRREEFARLSVIYQDPLRAYQEIYNERVVHKAYKKATTLLQRSDVREIRRKVRREHPEFGNREEILLHELLDGAQDTTKTTLERGRCMDLYIKSKRLLDIDDTNASDLPASIDQAIADIKADSV